ncbi:H(+)/Cl(-) exchange transporter 7-like protein [Dinothrombium tinctorium]|uniref:Chloride channel protein n=1 Tax=Dinothrombium tinctorium TaxID=1965070 RepID=A0A3S3P969_9ACAR|nr:H(+)/Cl(-) exchange transporter 7-like protein [Dinothrombium tinctorium]
MNDRQSIVSQTAASSINDRVVNWSSSEAIIDHSQDEDTTFFSSCSCPADDTINHETNNQTTSQSVPEPAGFRRRNNSTNIDIDRMSRSWRSKTDDSHQASNDKRSDRRGSLNLLSQKYESLDYDLCENMLYLEEIKKAGYAQIRNKEIVRWIIIFAIGVMTACTASFIVICVETLSQFKYKLLQKWVDKCVAKDCLVIPFAMWLATNAVPVFISSLLVTIVAPIAAGSGIPVIKCYLNGVKVPEVVRIKTFAVKALSVILSVVGGLAVGKEGPMIHCGAVIAAGISQGKSTTLNKDLRIFEGFREDREKRDFVSAGAAAGVAAAFGAPVGGVLFSLEEGASFWNQALTWRIFFCSMITTFTLNLILSAYHHHPGQLSYAGLINFGKFESSMTNYSFIELPTYIVMGVIGGLLGALYNYINYRITVIRIRYIYKKWAKILEAVVIALISASVGFLLIVTTNDCRRVDPSQVAFPVQYNCPEGEYSVMAALWFNTPEASVKALFHNKAETWTAISLSIFFIAYYCLSIVTYGLSISSGLFIPTLLTGAAWGRLFALALQTLFPHDESLNPGKFALIGAAAMLGGVVRMTISLTVILIEATGNITFGLPLMITLMISKWVGDYFNEGLYDIHIELASVPFLAWEPPSLSSCIYASEIMSTPVTTFKAVEKVSRIIHVLKHEPHNGFPVVDVDFAENDLVSSTSSLETSRNFGRFRGLILRWQLIILLQEKIFNENAEKTLDMLTLKTFRNAYPRYPKIDSVHVTNQEYNYTIDLRPIMNPSAYSVSHAATLPRIFRLFRALGLRHLVVTNDRNEVIGIVTRKDLARYKMHFHNGRVTLFELQVSDN